MVACRCFTFLSLILLLPTLARAQFDEEADLIPGLLVTFEAGGRRIEQIDADLSYVWGTDAPDQRLPQGPFEATWASNLLLRDDGDYSFHAYLQGEISVEVDGQKVLETATNDATWVSGDPVRLDFGLLELKIRFRSTSDAARMQLFWSSERFPLEPIPPHQLFREDGRPDLALVEEGRRQFAAHRCSRCHIRENTSPVPPGPALFHVTSGMNRNWLIAKLLNETPEAAHGKMPSFGFSREDAVAVAAWIEYMAQPAELVSTPAPKLAKAADSSSVETAGQVLMHSLGCLACHTAGELGDSSPFGGGDLTHIGSRRTADWINTWLSRPERLNAQHRMPVFKLTPNERALLATALSKMGRKGAFDEIVPSGKQETDLVMRGRKLAEAARCAACHNIPAMEADLAGVPSLKEPVRSWENSCLAAADRQINRPLYRNINAEAIQAYVEARVGELSPPAPFARGRHVLEERNCLGCHERDLSKGIVSTAGAVAAQVEGLRGQSETLIPPSLTAVGDKLNEEPLSVAVSGEQKELRLPWLKVQMPRFRHSDEEKRHLVSYLVDHDRIPDGSPTGTPGNRTDDTIAATAAEQDGGGTGEVGNRRRVPTDPQTLVIGRMLTGSGGFNCVACHKFGEYEPRNVALGTRGSDLKQISRRMREDFFHRWTRDPLRVVPGIEMPSIKQAVQGVLDDDLDAQLAAVWASINDPNFTAPPNPAQVEQHILVQPGEGPRILRDVFTVSEGNGGGYVSRGIAMGFSNGHSLLFDIDHFCIRGWTFGDFAQQRTEGKSWYWDLAGVEAVTGFGTRPTVQLAPAGSGRPIEPMLVDASRARLIRYRQDAESVVVECELQFDLPDQDEGHIVTVLQTFEPWESQEAGRRYTGIIRRFEFRNVPEGFEITLVTNQTAPPASASAAHSRIDSSERLDRWSLADTLKSVPAKTDFLLYYSTLEPVNVAPQPRPELPRDEAAVTTLPGFTGQRLKLPTSVMPTAIGWTSDGRLSFTSLKGHVFLAHDSDGDGLEDDLVVFEEGLAAPFGILAEGDSLLVAHKPELLRLRDSDGDGRADEREIIADGWGYTDNYHDWTTGPVRDKKGYLYLALGSDYQQPERPRERSSWRGKVLKVDPRQPRSSRVTPHAHELRFPQGIALDSKDRLFVTDQQGVANTFNEINHIVEGRRYGVEAMHEEVRDAPESPPAVQIPHPWTRSVNGLLFLPEDLSGPLAPFAGHALGAEYNSRFLIRASFQEVGGELQGATYYFSQPTWDDDSNTFLGPISLALGPNGDLYVGSIHDSGWLGGQNTGEIVRLSPSGDAPNGIRELRATSSGFEIEFLAPIDAVRATESSNYSLSGYTRVWEGSYATPDSGRYSPLIESIEISDDRRTVTLQVDELRESYVYELNCTGLAASLFPVTGHYTMNRIPE